MTFRHSEGEYAVWKVPGAERSVYYWLSLFHEIDFQVNEGFRRIPHGGIEIGGLLFGSADENSMSVEAFRNIECEHSRGPSFVLSERDVNLLREQITAAAADPELKDLQLLGWFIAHTRSPLEVNETEAVLFRDLIPTGRLMILVKPERFQPTRFLFVVTSPEGKLDVEAASAIILPLPGRAQRAEREAVPSLLAASPESPPAMAKEEAGEQRIPIKERVSEAAAESKAPAALSPLAVPVVAAASDLPSVEEIRRRRSEIIARPEPVVEKPATPNEITKPTAPRIGRSNAQLAIVLFVAAALGCAVGYSIYLQLPPAVIPLEIQKHTPVLTVSWPREQTRDAVYAVLRIDDGDPIPLSTQQKTDGQAEIPSKGGGNVKIELIAQHWMRDSRGIVRYVEPVTAQPTPTGGPPQ